MYRRIIYPVLQRFDAEQTHNYALNLVRLVEAAPWLRKLLYRVLYVDDPRLSVQVWGIHFANPLGLAAGLDKNAVAVETWGALGFGHVEVGTVTPVAQPGNSQPRLFRLPRDQALINRMGFPSAGAPVIVERLVRLSTQRPVVGVNIGANKASVEQNRAVEDYVQALTYLAPHADYLTINISSPNTARLRALQGKAALTALIAEAIARRDELPIRKPLLLKIAPDLTFSEIDDIITVCLAHGVDGLIATNTTIARPATLRSVSQHADGGLSGWPLRDRSTEIIRYIYRSTAGQLPIIGVGGVFNAADAWAKLAAGATLVQVYTGFVYEGPLMAYRINRGLGQLLQQHGFASLVQVVGSDIPL